MPSQGTLQAPPLLLLCTVSYDRTSPLTSVAIQMLTTHAHFLVPIFSLNAISIDLIAYLTADAILKIPQIKVFSTSLQTWSLPLNAHQSMSLQVL